MDFTAVKDFWSDELQSQYAAGLSYTARDADKKLLSLVPKWVKEGKAVYGRAPSASVGGEG